MKRFQSLEELTTIRIAHNLTSFDGLTPTALAIVHNYIRTLKIMDLIEIIVNTGNWEILEIGGIRRLNKREILEIAGRRGDIDRINELAVDIADYNWAMDYAARGGHMDIVRLLEEYQLRE